jgi:hypothetical protein
MSALRKWFGPSKEEVWRKLCSETGARYVDAGFWKGQKVTAAHGPWTIILDTYAVSTGKVTMVFTRLRAPYINPDGFRFTVYRRGFFSEIAKFMGMQDVEVGHPDFDRDFIIKGRDVGKLRALFGNARIRELISAQPEIHFEVKDNHGGWGPSYPPDVDELRFHVVGVIKDVERLKLLFELFAETLDELCRIGSAYEGDPKVRV